MSAVSRVFIVLQPAIYQVHFIHIINVKNDRTGVTPATSKKPHKQV